MRIQILPLPSVQVGDDMTEPFALIVDQCEYESLQHVTPAARETLNAAWKRFAEECGARSIFVTDDTVDVVDLLHEQQEIREVCSVCDNGEAAVCSCDKPCWNPDCPKAIREAPTPAPAMSYGAIAAILFGRRMIIQWPDGPPPWLDRRELAEQIGRAAQATLQPTPFVIGDRNGKAVKLTISCSCGETMYRDDEGHIPNTRDEAVSISCNGCGNRLTITIPLTATPAETEPLDQPCFYLDGDEDGGVSLHCRDHFDGGRPLARYSHVGDLHPDKAVPDVNTLPELREAAARHLTALHAASDGEQT
ncbi:hypothetical protein ACFWYW_55560 [Nonomuraea sp. NPDC059023]|uniref:hypothetical protein n=1 Tax=unclassified Nonomuraea TaxID=2593643 RepID=UPI00369A9B55